MKKRGFGKGKYNGFGGKNKENESLEETAVRELLEESGIKVSSNNVEKKAVLDFSFIKKPEWNQQVHVFVAKNWKGSAIESEEMKPQWFEFKEIPFDKMWQDDIHWLPLVLKGKKLEASFTFDEDNETVRGFDIKENFIN